MTGQLRRRIYHLLEEPEQGGRLGRAVQIFLVALIALNVTAVMLDTVDDVATEWAAWFWNFEVFSVVIFTVEYLLRLWMAPQRQRFARPLAGRIRWMLTPLALLDLVAILPFYLPVLLPLDLRFLRALRMLRLMRLLKVGRYSSALRILRSVLADRKEELLATLSILVVLVVMASGLMYVVEHEAQPQVFSSMPATAWWAVATLTTMSNGDMKPETTLGKVLASMIAVCGIGLFALPAGILGSGFIEKYMEGRGRRRCPHCGRNLADRPDHGHPDHPPQGQGKEADRRA
jgi:voltage-gated potassium channel